MQVPTSGALEKRESVFSTLPPWHPTHGRVLPSEGPSHDLLNLEDASGEQTVGRQPERCRARSRAPWATPARRG